jgi:hypothetical protein
MVVVNLGECLRGSGARPNRTRGVEGASAADTSQVSRVSSMNRGGGDMKVYIGLCTILA